MTIRPLDTSLNAIWQRACDQRNPRLWRYLTNRLWMLLVPACFKSSDMSKDELDFLWTCVHLAAVYATRCHR